MPASLFGGETDALDELPWVSNNQGERMLGSLAVDGDSEREVLAVLQHLAFP